MTDKSSNERVALLERIARLATELCVSVDKAAEDIGGERPALYILRDIGPLTDQLEKLGPEPAAGVGVTDLAGSSLRTDERLAETALRELREALAKSESDSGTIAVYFHGRDVLEALLSRLDAPETAAPHDENVTARCREIELAKDRMVYGTSYVRIDADGRITRIHPNTVMIGEQPPATACPPHQFSWGKCIWCDSPEKSTAEGQS